MNKRFEKLFEIIKNSELDGVFIYSNENRRYLSGFKGSTGYLVANKEKAVFITDFRYVEQAKEQCKDCEIVKHESSLYDTVKQVTSDLGIKKMGIEDSFMTVNVYEALKANIEDIELVSLKDSIESLRIIKDKEEIQYIAKAAEIGDKVFEHLLGYIKAGMTEKEVELEMDSAIKKFGGEAMSFTPIVASGVRSSLPHGSATEKVINNGEFLTLDFGCVYNGYCSDMTRTIFIGKASDKHKKIYDIVLKAETEALNNIKSGILGKDVDKIARDIISSEGYGNNFGHGLGHGVGLAVHEEPRLSPLGNKALASGMVVTDEPGIYISDFGGVRIEDLVVVEDNGCRILTKSPKELIEL